MIRTAVVLTVVALIGCTAPMGDDLFVDLARIGVNVRSLEEFPTEPFDAEGTLLCVAGDKVRQYTFATVEEAHAAAQSIDPNDPSLIGNSVVDWVGQPRFWYRSRSLILYAGQNELVEQVLTRVLGASFASRPDAGRAGPDFAVLVC